jgi:hypothetical protein
MRSAADFAAARDGTSANALRSTLLEVSWQVTGWANVHSRGEALIFPLTPEPLAMLPI